jgi:hypothetical protein
MQLRYLILLFFALLCRPEMLVAQPEIGLRFSSDFNYFGRAEEYPLVNGWFSTGILGVFLRSYSDFGGYEAGFNIVHKPATGGLPVIMKDFLEGQSLGMTAIEMDLKVGPRFKAINPKIGYLIGYRFRTEGFLEPGSPMREIQKFYIILPFGASVDLPTNWGNVGFGAYYELGILNVIKKPDGFPGGFFEGGKIRGINFEITATWKTRMKTDLNFSGSKRQLNPRR